jgi:transcriptional regulator of acetoin/glycerol metabolism
MARARSDPDGRYWHLMDLAEKQIILEAYYACQGDVPTTAHYLGISWPYLYKRMRALGLSADGTP